jgi:hypothetical protein
MSRCRSGASCAHPAIDAHPLDAIGLTTGRARFRYRYEADGRIIPLMAKSLAKPKKRRGRPATGRGAVTAIRLSVDLRRRIDAWAAGQPDAPGRSEAIRRLVEIALAAASATPTPKKTVAKARRLAGEAIDRLVDKSAAPAEQAKRKRRLIKGPPEFRAMRADLPKEKRR